jgi:hypothetical protein
MRAALALLPAFVTPPYSYASVEDLVANSASRSGDLVRVIGRMGECRFLSCLLWPARPSEVRDRRPLSIGRVDLAFDMKASEYRGKMVALVARFDAKCLKPGTTCLHRPATLQPLSADALTLLKGY